MRAGLTGRWFRLWLLYPALLATPSLAATHHPPAKSGTPLRHHKAIPWQAASFHGLKLGHATRAEVLRAFGAPNAERETTFSGAGGPAHELVYERRGDHQGRLLVRLNRVGLVEEIVEQLPVALPRTIVYRELGNDAQTAHYSFVSHDRTLRRDARGPLELTLYPTQGIALWPESLGYDFASILYLDRAPGMVRGGKSRN